nr:uncharacterized protein LOC113811612 isoform X1 [Penaeus vannamei]
MNCSINIDYYKDNSTYVAQSLLVYGVVHNYIVFFLGTFANSVVLWCISRCTKTNMAMKLLMMSVFASLLVICLITRPVMAERLIGNLYCDPTRPDMKVLLAFALLYSFCAQFELAAIAVVACAGPLQCGHPTPTSFACGWLSAPWSGSLSTLS